MKNKEQLLMLTILGRLREIHLTIGLSICYKIKTA